MTKSNTEAMMLHYLQDFGISPDIYENNIRILIRDYINMLNRQHNADWLLLEHLDEKMQDFYCKEFMEAYCDLLRQIASEKGVSIEALWNQVFDNDLKA